MVAALKLRVAEGAPRLIFVHAAVAGWQDAALVLPASSMAGKSTLLVQLLRRGAVYLLG